MMAILFIGAFVAFLNNTLLNIALPTIMDEFSVKPSQVQWLTTGFMLVNGILIPASAFFIQNLRIGRLFITAMTLFSIGTLLAIFAPSFGVLVASRMIQASGSAMMMPLLMNVMFTAFPIERRGTAMGLFGLVMFTWRLLLDRHFRVGCSCIIHGVHCLLSCCRLQCSHLSIQYLNFEILHQTVT